MEQVQIEMCSCRENSISPHFPNLRAIMQP